MHRKTIRIALIALGALLFVWLLFTRLRSTGPLDAVPDQNALLFRFNTLDSLQGRLRSLSSGPEKILAGMPFFRQIIDDAKIADALFQHDSTLAHLVYSSILYATLSGNENDEGHPLFLVDGLPPLDLEQILAAHPGNYRVFPARFKGVTHHTVHLDQSLQFTLAQHKGVLLLGRFAHHVEDAIAQLEQGKSRWNNRKMLRLFDEKACLNLAVRPEALDDFLSRQLKAEWAFAARSAAAFHWICFSWDGSRLAGHAIPRHQFGFSRTGMHEGMESVLPDNLALLTQIDFSESAWLVKTGLSQRSRYFERYVEDWLGDEAALAVMPPRTQDLLGESLVLFKTEKPEAAENALEEYATRYGMIEQREHNTFVIRQMLRPGILSWMGADGSPYLNPCAVVVGEYVVFADQMATLETLLDKYLVGQTLNNQADFQKIKPDAADRNALVYTSGAGLSALLQIVFQKEGLDRYRTNREALGQLGQLACNVRFPQNGPWEFGWRHTGGQALNNTPASILWRLPLQSAAFGPVLYVRDMDGGARLLIQDQMYQLYCLGPGGELYWRRDIGEPLISGVFPVDLFRNGSTCLTFNTARHLYLLDEQGNNVQGFPLPLQSRATNGLTVVDFDNIKDYRYFLACENGNLYGYDRFGRPLPGWNPNPSGTVVREPLRHFVWKDMDFLLVRGESGLLKAFGRNAEERMAPIQLKGPFANSLQVKSSGLVARIVALNQEGTLYIVYPDGKVETYATGLPDAKLPKHLVYEPFAGDARSDFALLSGSTLELHGFKGNEIRRFFSVPIPDHPDTLFYVSGARIGAVDRAKNRILCYGSDGKAWPGFPLAGSTPFLILNTGPKAPFETLITGYGDAVYAYSLAR